MNVLEQLNNDYLSKTNVSDYRIIKFSYEDDDKLIIAGSFDFSYYHQIEIYFYEVTIISCPTYFSDAKFRLATDIEKQLLEHRGFDIEDIEDIEDKLVVCIVVDESYGTAKEYYIAAREMEYKIGTVFYYKRDNLKEGERIADWVK